MMMAAAGELGALEHTSGSSAAFWAGSLPDSPPGLRRRRSSLRRSSLGSVELRLLAAAAAGVAAGGGEGRLGLPHSPGCGRRVRRNSAGHWPPAAAAPPLGCVLERPGAEEPGPPGLMMEQPLGALLDVPPLAELHAAVQQQQLQQQRQWQQVQPMPRRRRATLAGDPLDDTPEPPLPDLPAEASTAAGAEVLVEVVSPAGWRGSLQAPSARGSFECRHSAVASDSMLLARARAMSALLRSGDYAVSEPYGFGAGCCGSFGGAPRRAPLGADDLALYPVMLPLEVRAGPGGSGGGSEGGGAPGVTTPQQQSAGTPPARLGGSEGGDSGGNGIRRLAQVAAGQQQGQPLGPQAGHQQGQQAGEEPAAAGPPAALQRSGSLGRRALAGLGRHVLGGSSLSSQGSGGGAGSAPRSPRAGAAPPRSARPSLDAALAGLAHALPAFLRGGGGRAAPSGLGSDPGAPAAAGPAVEGAQRHGSGGGRRRACPRQRSGGRGARRASRRIGGRGGAAAAAAAGAAPAPRRPQRPRPPEQRRRRRRRRRPVQRRQPLQRRRRGAGRRVRGVARVGDHPVCRHRRLHRDVAAGAPLRCVVLRGAAGVVAVEAPRARWRRESAGVAAAASQPRRACASRQPAPRSNTHTHSPAGDAAAGDVAAGQPLLPLRQAD
jgi:hypothetical protein